MKKLKLPKFKLGADPEFCIPNGVHYSSRRVGRSGELGRDHGGAVGELRPRPGNPARVVKNLRTMISEIPNVQSDSEIFGGGGKSFGRSSGGHIHFGFRGKAYKIWDFHRERYSLNFQSFVRALDHYLGRPLRKHKGGRREHSMYGHLGDIRPQPHGFEYRTPPSWLTSPELAQAVLTVAYTIGQIYLHRKSFWAREFAKRKALGKSKRFCITDIELLKKFSLEKDHQHLDRYINLMRDRNFDLEASGTIERWLA